MYIDIIVSTYIDHQLAMHFTQIFEGAVDAIPVSMGNSFIGLICHSLDGDQKRILIIL